MILCEKIKKAYTIKIRTVITVRRVVISEACDHR